MIESIILWWLLPALITSLLMFDGMRRYKGSPTIPERFSEQDWMQCIALSIFWPIGIAGYIFIFIWPILIKERKWKS